MAADIQDSQAQALPQIGQYQIVPSAGRWYVFELGADPQLAPTTIADFGTEAKARRVASALALLDVIPDLFVHPNPFTWRGSAMLRLLQAIFQFSCERSAAVAGQ